MGSRRRASLFRKAGGLLVAVVGMLAALAYHEQTAVERPAFLATALMAPVGCDWQVQDCVATDVNLQVFPDGRVVTEQPTFGTDGHASLPEWKAPLGPLPDGAIPFAPIMGWNTGAFMTEVAGKSRPMRYCAEERRQWDAAHPGFDTAGGGYWALRDILDQFDVLPPEEDCTRPDLVMGANAEVDCGGPGAWGCAALQFQGSRPYVRVTFNGKALAEGSLPRSGVRTIDWHEFGHAADLGHTGEYGGEGRAHAHRSNLGYICVTGGEAYPCDNPTGEPGTEDFHAPTAGGYRYGLRLKPVEPPPPPPPPVQTRVVAQRWIEANREPCAQPSGDWCISTVEVGGVGADGAFFTLVRVRPDGGFDYPYPFELVEP